MKPAGDAANQTAAAHADEHRVWQAALLFDFKRQRACASDDLGLVIRMGEQRAGFLLARQAGLKRFKVSRSRYHHLGSQSDQPGALGEAGHLGHEHLAAHTQLFGCGSGGNASISA